MKLINDTLKNKEGKWSRKSLTALASFVGAIVYEFVLPFWELATKEYVWTGLLLLCGTSLGLTVVDKFKK